MLIYVVREFFIQQNKKKNKDHLCDELKSKIVFHKLKRRSGFEIEQIRTFIFLTGLILIYTKLDLP